MAMRAARAVLLATLLTGGAGAAPLLELPRQEAARLVTAAGLADAPFTIEAGTLGGGSTKTRWLIHIYNPLRPVARYCFAEHKILGVWHTDTGAYEIYGRDKALTMWPHRCRKGAMHGAIDIKGEVKAEDAAAVLDRALAFARTRGASEPDSKITFAPGELHGLLRDVAPGRLRSMTPASNGESNVCFARPHWPGEYCFRLAKGAVTLTSTFKRCRPGDDCDESWMWNLK
jgi:hypothetical protein